MYTLLGYHYIPNYQPLRKNRDKMNTLQCMRSRVSQFRPSTLPRVTRQFSASAKQNYEFILTSEPRPGVGQGKSFPPLFVWPGNQVSPAQLALLTLLSDHQPSKGTQCPLHSSHHRDQPSTPRLPGQHQHQSHHSHWLIPCLRRRCRYQGDGTTHLLQGVHRVLHSVLVRPDYLPHQAIDHRRLWPRSRWRLRARHDG